MKGSNVDALAIALSASYAANAHAAKSLLLDKLAIDTVIAGHALAGIDAKPSYRNFSGINLLHRDLGAIIDSLTGY